MSPLLFSASIALALFVVAVDLSAEDKETELGEMKMSEVPTGEGFKLFAGAYDRSEFPTNFITIYTYKNIGDVPRVHIVGRSVDEIYPVSELDAALSRYRNLVLERWK